MGAYVSTANCAANYGTTVNCTVVLSKDNSTALLLGEIAPGEFVGDPDIAGAGVLGAFLIVTVASLLLAIASSAWWAAKNVFGVVNRLTREEKSLKNWQISIAGIIEALIVTCSDQQVFTGGAYAITLRYAKACSVSAYHYNIVANILLVTCATHLMAITVSRHYWEHAYVGGLRIVVTTLVFVITGVLLSNQGSGSLGFPTEVPPHSDQYSLMLLPAACFQTGDFAFDREIEKAFHASSAGEFFTGQIHGWPNYLIMFLFYIIAVFISLGRVVRRGMGHNGKRKRFIAWLKMKVPFLFRIKRVLYLLFGIYLVAGIALTSWTVVIAAIYVFQLRWWLDRSGWMGLTNNLNPENDPSTFGQLVPLLLMSLTVFTFLQIISERIHARHKRAKRLEYASLRHRRGSNSHSSSPSYRTRYSTSSVLDVRSSNHHDRDHVHDINHHHQQQHQQQQQQQLYDHPYNNDKHKSEPVVGVRMVKEPDDDIPPEQHEQHPHAHVHDRGGLGDDDEQRRWTITGGGSIYAGAGYNMSGGGIVGGQQRPASVISSSSTASATTARKKKKMGLFERMARSREEDKDKRRGSAGRGGDDDARSSNHHPASDPDLPRGPYTMTGQRRQHSALSLPVGVGAGFPVQPGAAAAAAHGRRPASGEWFVRGAQTPPPLGQVPQEHDMGLGLVGEEGAEDAPAARAGMYRGVGDGGGV